MKIFCVTILTALLGLSNVAVAGEYADKLSSCLKSSLDHNDKRTLVRWVFSMYAAHPDVSDMSAVSAAESEEIARKGAAVFEKLITDKCAAQSRDVLLNEGMKGYGSSFASLGETAVGDLVQDASVRNTMKKLYQYIDNDKLMKALLTGSPQKK